MTNWNDLLEEKTTPEFDQKVLSKAKAELSKLRDSKASRRSWLKVFVFSFASLSVGVLGWISIRKLLPHEESTTDTLALEFNPNDEELSLLADEGLDLASDMDFFESLEELEAMEEA